MRKKLQNKVVTLASSLMKHIKLNTILPFQERPSIESASIPREDPATEDSKKPLAAAELFSLFTADIIKEDAVFTR